VSRTPYLVLASTAFLLAACGGNPPPPQVVVTPPPATQPAPTTVVLPPSSGAAATASPLVNQCQSMFAQSLNGGQATYGSPVVNTIGDVTTVRLTAQVSQGVAVMPRQYSCTFSRGTLTTAGAV
jgi:hypothetical protein